MANALGLYDPLFYANEAMIELRRALGMAGRVFRGFDRNPQEKGSKIMISRPGSFVAQDAPSTAQDLNPGQTEMSLDYWKEVKFFLTDKELAFTQEKIINDHIRPAAYAIANDIDVRLAALAQDIPWFINVTAPAGVADITAARKVLFQNGVPINDPGRMHMMVDGQLESEFLNLSAFSQHQGADGEGVETQRTGSLGRKFGFEVFANQNVRTHVPGVAADADGTLSGAHAKGAKVVTIAGLTAAGTVKKGDSFVIAGNTQRYVFSADATADGSGVITNAAIFPELVQAYSNGAVVNISLVAHVQNIAFHENAFALAMAPLPRLGDQLGGARIETVVDDISGLALRSRMWYVGDTSRVYVALDVLYGMKTLDPNMAVVLRD